MEKTRLRLRLLGGVSAALRSRFGNAIPVRHRTFCFDTPDLRLSRAGLVLALTEDGESWSQQAALLDGDAELAQNLPLPRRRRALLPQPELHRASPVGALLDAALGNAPLSPVPVSSLALKRRTLLMRTNGARIQVALIEGTLSRDASLRRPIREIELCLKSGPPAAVYQVGRRLAEQQAMYLEPGDPLGTAAALAQGRVGPAPIQARPPQLAPGLTRETALKLMIQACLHQIVGNIASLMAGSTDPEHLHQLRVGLRRLRSVLRLFGAWASVPADSWEQALSKPSQSLGALRDMDVLRSEVLPRLAELGGPHIEPDTKKLAAGSLQAILGSPSFTGVLISMLAYAHAEASPALEAGQASKLARKKLSKLSKRLRTEAKDFATTDDLERHRLRKRFKRLRYSLEMASGLLPDGKSLQMLSSIKPVQDALGQYNDMCMADAHFRRLPNSPGAELALAWTAARRAEALSQAILQVARWRRGETRE
jgi:CHAD domain-containing protein